jgi:hypothetical protein
MRRNHDWHMFVPASRWHAADQVRGKLSPEHALPQALLRERRQAVVIFDD